MDPNIEARLQQIEAKLEQNTEIVTKTRKVQKTAGTIRVVYWIFLILLALGAFYFVGPFMSQIKNVYGLGDSKDSDSINELFNQIKAYQENTQ